MRLADGARTVATQTLSLLLTAAIVRGVWRWVSAPAVLRGDGDTGGPVPAAGTLTTGRAVASSVDEDARELSVLPTSWKRGVEAILPFARETAIKALSTLAAGLVLYVLALAAGYVRRPCVQLSIRNDLQALLLFIGGAVLTVVWIAIWGVLRFFAGRVRQRILRRIAIDVTAVVIVVSVLSSPILIGVGYFAVGTLFHVDWSR